MLQVVFMGRMSFLSPILQCRYTKGKLYEENKNVCKKYSDATKSRQSTDGGLHSLNVFLFNIIIMYDVIVR